MKACRILFDLIGSAVGLHALIFGNNGKGTALAVPQDAEAEGLQPLRFAFFG